MTFLIDRLRRLATWLCTRASLERRIEPTLTDLRNEYLDAVIHGRYWKSRWIQAAGCLIVLKVVGLVTLESALRSVTHLDARTRTALFESAGIFGIVVPLATIVLMWPEFNRKHPRSEERTVDVEKGRERGRREQFLKIIGGCRLRGARSRDTSMSRTTVSVLLGARADNRE